jgi:hypothetical protein
VSLYKGYVTDHSGAAVIDADCPVHPNSSLWLDFKLDTISKIIINTDTRATGSTGKSILR